jgi:hypothetical protein
VRVSAWHGRPGRRDSRQRAGQDSSQGGRGLGTLRCAANVAQEQCKTTWRVVNTIAAIDGEVFQADGRGDLRMQQAAAKFSHEILWW